MRCLAVLAALSAVALLVCPPALALVGLAAVVTVARGLRATLFEGER